MRETQTATIAWLGTLGGYKSHDATARGEGVVRVETPTSLVFLVDGRAYKLKRAGRHHDLDYSTSEQRHASCLEEVRLNRRTAPKLYGRVRAVTAGPDGSLSLDGRGHAIDWVVEMQRFDSGSRFDQLADQGALDVTLMPQLADAVVRLHELAEWQFDRGGLDVMTQVIQRDHVNLRQQTQQISDQATCERVIEQNFELMHRHAERLESRRLSGFVRRGHGDLQLRNVCVFDSEPTLFDCADQCSASCCIDVMCDLALLLVDLLRRGLDHHANVVLNRYVERTGDVGGLSPLPLFLSARATTLAGTAPLRLDSDGQTTDATQDDLRSSLALACRLMEPTASPLVVVAGPSGSGKTTLARRLAATIGPAPGALILHDELERRRLVGASPEASLGTDGYSAGVTRQVYRTLAERAGQILREGHAVLVDAVYSDPVERAMLVDIADKHGAPIRGLWLEASSETRGARMDRLDFLTTDGSRVGARHREQGTPPTSWSHVDANGDPDSVWHAAHRTLTTT